MSSSALVWAVTGTGSSVQTEDPVTETDVTVMWLPRLQAITPQGVQRSQGHGSKDRRRHAHLLNESQPLSCRFSDCAAGLFPSQICPTLEVPRDPQGCTVLCRQNEAVVQVHILMLHGAHGLQDRLRENFLVGAGSCSGPSLAWRYNHQQYTTRLA